MIGRATLAVVLLGAAAPPPPGATSCSGCHMLAGRPATNTAAALEAFRSGARPATVMGRIAKGFSPEETKAIASWWAGQKP
jgi:cytochrome c553